MVLGERVDVAGIFISGSREGLQHFDEAKTCFQRALNEEPANEIYRKALEMTDKAPGLHAELQRQLAEQQIYHEASKTVQKSTKSVVLDDRKVSADFWYGVGGWLCFTGVAFSWTLLLARQKAF